MGDQPTTTEQLRRDIDKGLSGSKVDFPDPAAAPLGTDDEAGGNPPSTEQIREARRQEVNSAPSRANQQPLGVGAYVYAAIMAVIIVALAATIIWLRLRG